MILERSYKMGFTSSEEGMRFNVFRSDIHDTLVLRWLADNEKDCICEWYWHGSNAEQHLEEKLGEIALVCDGYTVHNYRSSGSKIHKYESTSCCSICRPETKEADDE
jgi:hypothetical protein